eukprot:m.238051 g.238051  ORF g.238051 m.238051 type:complete len:70 (+) comp40153_c0_seq38:3074-3283(+)
MISKVAMVCWGQVEMLCVKRHPVQVPTEGSSVLGCTLDLQKKNLVASESESESVSALSVDVFDLRDPLE